MKKIKETIIKIGNWINEKSSWITGYNKMLIIALAYLIGVGLRTFFS